MISKTGIWSKAEAKKSGYPKSEVLAKKLLQVFNKESTVLDFGCGDAYYLDVLVENYFAVYGVDGYLPLESPFVKKNIRVLRDKVDLSKKFCLPFFGQILSLEVGEHIPSQYESTFIDNLCRNCYNRIVLSWAIEGQGGLGHVNCRNNDYVIARLFERKFNLNPELTDFIRQGIEMPVRYFQDTLMVFDRDYSR